MKVYVVVDQDLNIKMYHDMEAALANFFEESSSGENPLTVNREYKDEGEYDVDFCERALQEGLTVTMWDLRGQFYIAKLHTIEM